MSAVPKMDELEQSCYNSANVIFFFETWLENSVADEVNKK